MLQQSQFDSLASTIEIISQYLWPVALQNTVNLVNGIFFVVSVALMVMGETHEAIFLGSVMAMNVIIGIIQDLKAKITLEKLQILTAPKIIRTNKDGNEEQIDIRDIAAADILKISLGDQIPADGIILESHGLEVNEALITGESNYIKKNQRDRVLAGSIAMAGSATMQAQSTPAESYVSKMTEKIKKYKPNPSPIQKTLNAFIKYMTYLLIAIIAYVIAHGLRINELFVSIVKDIGALTGTLVPQGLVLSTTVFFAYGAVKLAKEHILAQEINASEKLGRIKNLCLDKTGTLTSRKPALDNIVYCNDYSIRDIRQIIAAYVSANHDSSEIAQAIRACADQPLTGNIVSSLPFSSDRKYGAIAILSNNQSTAAAIGAPDVLAKYFSNDDERNWISRQINLYAPKAKRLVLLAIAAEPINIPLTEDAILHPVALFILSDPLRPGTSEIINFLQDRGVRIRVISGDNSQTVQAIARQAGIKYTDMVANGRDMENWDEVEYQERVPAFHLFARISPSQKEKIVKLLKKTGFTAMVGDGANDAMAIKKADLGIAMFDGAAATRQIAQVVLLKNNFSALPKSIQLSEAIIASIELVASIFFNKIVVGLSLFLIMSFLGYTYPLSPSNTTIINYFTIWLPMAYWTFFPLPQKELNKQPSFLKRILPFSAINALIMAAAAALVFLIEPAAAKTDSNILVIFTLIALGYWFFILVPINYGIVYGKNQKIILSILAVLIAVFISYSLYNPALSDFFELQKPEPIYALISTAIIIIFGYLQYAIAKEWFNNNQPSQKRYLQ